MSSILDTNAIEQKIIQRAINVAKPYYNQPNRFYHNINHIFYMINITNESEHMSLDGHDIILLNLAVLFHDVIYNTNNSDDINIRNSIKLFEDFANDISLSKESIRIVTECISATQTHSINQFPNNKLVKFIIYLDLAILCESNVVYNEYASNIRKEYAQYSDDEFNSGRLKSLYKIRHVLETLSRDSFFEFLDFVTGFNNIDGEINYLNSIIYKSDIFDDLPIDLINAMQRKQFTLSYSNMCEPDQAACAGKDIMISNQYSDKSIKILAVLHEMGHSINCSYNRKIVIKIADEYQYSSSLIWDYYSVYIECVAWEFALRVNDNKRFLYLNSYCRHYISQCINTYLYRNANHKDITYTLDFQSMYKLFNCKFRKLIEYGLLPSPIGDN